MCSVTAITGTRDTRLTPTVVTTPTRSSDSKQTFVYFAFVLAGLVSSLNYYYDIRFKAFRVG